MSVTSLFTWWELSLSWARLLYQAYIGFSEKVLFPAEIAALLHHNVVTEDVSVGGDTPQQRLHKPAQRLLTFPRT